VRSATHQYMSRRTVVAQRSVGSFSAAIYIIG
jgi:hypothetical protein